MDILADCHSSAVLRAYFPVLNVISVVLNVFWLTSDYYQE